MYCLLPSYSVTLGMSSHWCGGANCSRLPVFSCRPSPYFITLTRTRDFSANFLSSIWHSFRSIIELKLTSVSIHTLVSFRSIPSTFINQNRTFNPLNPELNPICYLLSLLGAHHFLHVSRIRVKLLTFRLLMSYICGAPILDVSRSHTTTQHSR